MSLLHEIRTLNELWLINHHLRKIEKLHSYEWKIWHHQIVSEAFTRFIPRFRGSYTLNHHCARPYQKHQVLPRDIHIQWVSTQRAAKKLILLYIGRLLRGRNGLCLSAGCFDLLLKNLRLLAQTVSKWQSVEISNENNMSRKFEMFRFWFLSFNWAPFQNKLNT